MRDVSWAVPYTKDKEAWKMLRCELCVSRQHYHLECVGVCTISCSRVERVTITVDIAIITADIMDWIQEWLLKLPYRASEFWLQGWSVILEQQPHLRFTTVSRKTISVEAHPRRHFG